MYAVYAIDVEKGERERVWVNKFKAKKIEHCMKHDKLPVAHAINVTDYHVCAYICTIYGYMRVCRFSITLNEMALFQCASVFSISFPVHIIPTIPYSALHYFFYFFQQKKHNNFLQQFQYDWNEIKCRLWNKINSRMFATPMK